jgi:hypothetical protein
MQKRWLFVWRDMSDPKEVDRMIARFPRVQADGYNGVAFSANVPPEKAPELKAAAKKYGLDIVAIVMGNSPDRNYTEGVLSQDALFGAHDGIATFRPDNHTEGVTTFADHEVVHGGKTSLRMENFTKNDGAHCRIMQPIDLQPHRQYRLSFWVKTENLVPAEPEIKVLTADSGRSISFETFHADKTQDWKHYDIVFNSLDNTKGNLYLGTWNGKEGKMWWDDLTCEEIGLVNVLRRPGCPVTVRAENGTVYEEGKDYAKIVDPELHPYRPYHDMYPIHLTPNSRIHDGDRLRVSYYHPLIVYEDRISSCLSEPKIFTDWQAEVKKANDLLHPAAFLMSHDEIRVINQCALCQSMHMTPGQLLAWNVHKATKIIRDLRPDAGIWVWNDMFDPLHNAVDHFYAVNGPLEGSWKGLDKDVGIVNWHGGLMGKNCKFFADLGHKQILSGYYDGDDDGAAITKWIANTRDVPGIDGAMYTTWEDRYDSMDRWAQKAWGGVKAP